MEMAKEGERGWRERRHGNVDKNNRHDEKEV